MQFLISAMITVGYLGQADSLSYVLKEAIRLTVPDHAFQSYLVGELSRRHAVPTKSTLNRHRLTLHVGLCLWLQQVHDDMFSAGAVSWRTLDASPIQDLCARPSWQLEVFVLYW